MLLCLPCFSLRKLGFIDISLKVLSLLQTTNLENRYERKSKMRSLIHYKMMELFDWLLKTDFHFFF